MPGTVTLYDYRKGIQIAVVSLDAENKPIVIDGGPVSRSMLDLPVMEIPGGPLLTPEDGDRWLEV